MKYKTALDKSIKKKKELAEAEDYIRQVDNPESMGGGRKFVVEGIKEDEKKEKASANKIKNILEPKRNTQHFSYRRSLADYGNWLLDEVKELGWEQEFVPTDGTRVKIYNRWFASKSGILLVLKNPRGEVFIRGIFMTYTPEYDEAAIKTLVIQAENTVDSYKGILLSDKK